MGPTPPPLSPAQLAGQVTPGLAHRPQPPSPTQHYMSRRAAGVGGLTARPQASCPWIACSESSSALGFTPISRATRPDIILHGAIASHHSCLFAGDGPAHSACVASCCQAPARASCCGSRRAGAPGGVAGPSSARGGSRLPGARGLARRRHRDEREGR